jgi:hypothetical protein
LKGLNNSSFIHPLTPGNRANILKYSKKTMKNYSHILCLIFLTSLISCNDEFRNTNVVLAGMYNSFSVYHEFLPTLAVKTELNIATGFYEGSDSIDLNLDDNFDLIISMRLHPNDTMYEMDRRLYYPTCRIELKNGFEVAVKKMNYSCGHGICNWADFIAAFEYGSDISDFTGWSESNSVQTLWNVFPPGAGYPYPRGWWSIINNEEMYIGVRHKHRGPKNTFYFNYGWIRVNAVSPQNTLFMSYAME